MKNREDKRNQANEKYLREQRRKDKMRRDKLKASKRKWGKSKPKRKERTRIKEDDQDLNFDQISSF